MRGEGDKEEFFVVALLLSGPFVLLAAKKRTKIKRHVLLCVRYTYHRISGSRPSPPPDALSIYARYCKVIVSVNQKHSDIQYRKTVHGYKRKKVYMKQI